MLAVVRPMMATRPLAIVLEPASAAASRQPDETRSNITHCYTVSLPFQATPKHCRSPAPALQCASCDTIEQEMSDRQNRDQIYATPQEAVKAFVFDEKVAAVFGDMINRSVPGYAIILEMTGVIARRYGRPTTRCYDLDCCLRASTLSLRHKLPQDSSNVAVLNYTAKIER